MAKGHWLDPLARSLLQATGRLPKPATASAPAAAKGPAAIEQAAAEAIEALSQPDGSDQEQIERDLLDLKLRQNPAMPLKDGE